VNYDMQRISRRLTAITIAALAVAAGIAPAASQAACPCTIWPSSTTPANPAFQDNSAIEVGVKFRSDTDGFVKGLRFYKGTQNTGTHIGNLWSNSGAKLASATFTNETPSGWQQVNFAGPVPISANTTYVASYHTDTGFYAFNGNFFATSGVDSPPLHALRDGAPGPGPAGETGNGVYRYGPSTFPDFTFNSANYWVDVVFDQTVNDVTPPQVTARTPAPGATGVAVSSSVTATFDEPVQAATIAMSVTGPSGAVAGSTSYDGPSQTARFTPAEPLAFSTAYTATVSGAKDAAGNTMSPVSWSFTTGAPPPPPPDPGTGGPVLLVTSSGNPFGSYYSEILRAEGLNEFSVIDVSQLSASALTGRDVVVLAETLLSTSQVTALTDFVNAGGSLVAMRPDAKLAGLLGITKGTGTLADSYLAVNTSVEAAAGITAETMQYHGTADRYSLNGATSVANLYSNASTATTDPAVTLRTVGANGGQVAAFTYDLARSVVYTRQGNPAWAGQERDGVTPIRSNDLFFGVGQPDWVDPNKRAIPQADEQQRLLANLIETMNRHRKPLPRFWYFPRSLKAVVIGTGDDHAGGGTAGRFDQYLANSPAGCSVADWTCPRFTSYIYTNTALSNSRAATYNSQGFEIGLHPSTDCQDFTDASLAQTFSTQLSRWRNKYRSLPSPVSNRTHCLLWSNWLGEPRTELANGMRLDANYYYYPPSWVQNRPGVFNGSGIPMRFADTNGAVVNVFQAATAMTDESGQSYPFTPNALLDAALGPQGYYGAFMTNFHTDGVGSFENDQTVASARARGVPIVAARQMLTWLDGREKSSFTNVAYSGGTLTFSVTVGAGAAGLTAMVPTASADGQLSSVTRGGNPVSYSTETIKGLAYAIFPAVAGTYSARYTAPPAGGPAISALRSSTGEPRTAAISWKTNRPATTEIAFREAGSGRARSVVVAEAARPHRLKLRQFKPGRTYRYRVRSRDEFGRVTVHPRADTPPAIYRVPARRAESPEISHVRAVGLPDGTATVEWNTTRSASGSVRFGASASALNDVRLESGAGTAHDVGRGGLLPGRRYHYRVSSRTQSGTVQSSRTLAFQMPRYGVADSRWAQFRMGRASGVVVSGQGDGELRLAASRSSGTFGSRVMDTQQIVGWRRSLLDADVPAGTTLQVQARSGSMSAPDASWTPWIDLAGNDAALPRGVKDSRYLQYRVTLMGSRSASPVVRSVGFTSTGVGLQHPKEGSG
jgi:Domain of unknown function (DUF4082)/Bacterial Ig-like domain